MNHTAGIWSRRLAVLMLLGACAANAQPSFPSKPLRIVIPHPGESDFMTAKGDAIRTDYVGYLQSYPGTSRAP